MSEAPAATRVQGPGPFVYHFVRLGLKVIVSGYLRLRVEGAQLLPPTGGALVCFNHPSWLDPIMIAASWPDRTRRVFIFGPRERDMTRGIRNVLITWTRRGVPFKPGGADALDASRRSIAILRGGEVLAVAGEGRLSDHEGQPLPLEPGIAHFAMLARVPIVPLAIVGTRWVRFGGTVQLTYGEPIDPMAHGTGKQAATLVTADVQAALGRLLDGVTDSPRPGPVGAWISEAFNDRPWLEDSILASMMYAALDMAATRTQIYLTREQRRRLDERSRREGRTMADVIRSAVDAYLDVMPDRDTALAATFGSIPDLDVPSRDEWDRA